LKRTLSALVLAAASFTGCGTKAAPDATPCDQACQDGTALRALREMMKLMFNLKLQGKPVGPQDATTPCPLGGMAHVFGEATSNAVQGSTDVMLTYEFDACGYLEKDVVPARNYRITLTGTARETGTLAVQPTATTALMLKSDAMTFSGTVYDPPIDYAADACPVAVAQSGNAVSGLLCGRPAGFGF
jgi:hypothetical protein